MEVHETFNFESEAINAFLVPITEKQLYRSRRSLQSNFINGLITGHFPTYSGSQIEELDKEAAFDLGTGFCVRRVVNEVNIAPKLKIMSATRWEQDRPSCPWCRWILIRGYTH